MLGSKKQIYPATKVIFPYMRLYFSLIYVIIIQKQAVLINILQRRNIYHFGFIPVICDIEDTFWHIHSKREGFLRGQAGKSFSK